MKEYYSFFIAALLFIIGACNHSSSSFNRHINSDSLSLDTLKSFGRIENLDFKKGFKDIKLGTPFSEFSNLIFSRKKDNFSIYEQVPDTSLMEKSYWGKFRIGKIYYYFYHDSLARLSVILSGINDDPYTYLLAAYGKPTKEVSWNDEHLIYSDSRNDMKTSYWTGNAVRLLYSRIDPSLTNYSNYQLPGVIFFEQAIYDRAIIEKNNNQELKEENEKEKGIEDLLDQ